MLKIRQLTDKTFQELGMSELYIGKMEGNYMNIKGIYIMTPCGKPLFPLVGIEIPRNASIADKEYAASLINKILNERKGDIEVVWGIYQNRLRLEDFNSKYNLNYSSSLYNSESKSTSTPGFRLENGDHITIKYFVESESYFISCDSTPSNVQKILKDLPKYKAEIQKFKEYWEAVNHQDKVVAELTTCNI